MQQWPGPCLEELTVWWGNGQKDGLHSEGYEEKQLSNTQKVPEGRGMHLWRDSLSEDSHLSRGLNEPHDDLNLPSEWTRTQD